MVKGTNYARKTGTNRTCGHTNSKSLGTQCSYSFTPPRMSLRLQALSWATAQCRLTRTLSTTPGERLGQRQRSLKASTIFLPLLYHTYPLIKTMVVFTTCSPTMHKVLWSV